MSRIATPATIIDAPTDAQPLLDAVNAQLGVVPNLFRLVATSPQALEGLLGLSGALGKGKLTVATRNRIALAVAEANGCDYCLSAHTYLGRNLAKLDDAEITANRSGASNDPKADAAIRFASRLVKTSGHVGAEEVKVLAAAGYSDAEVLEIIAHVALNTFTNLVNSALGTEIDFPVVSTRRAA
ncbi:carboxymuconolactone decarboxylase family protein [Novosphingobium sp.]|uniref:carboxymuconolactone decarboxylase family protein n=1 Tax=Novosphingobium sp. TaxID=1874826 RepID=UPI0026209CC3|nr:peroxidase-related enzyme [Novosphingobium sp.]